MSNVQSVSGQHSVLRMVPSNDAQMMQQCLPSAGFVNNSHAITSQLQQGQAAVQMMGQEVQQSSLLVEGATVNHLNHNVNLPVYTNTVSTPCVSFPAAQINSSTLGSNTEQDSSSTRAGGMSQASGVASSQESADTGIPSLQALRNSADIHKKVNTRYQELEDSNKIEQGSLELLLQTLHKKVKNDEPKVKWPQELAFVGTLRR